MTRLPWRDQGGVTLVEIIISMTIASFLVIFLVMGMAMVVRRAPESSDQLVAQGDLRQAAYWIHQDGAMALSFAPGTNPVYGTFSGPDYTASAAISRTVTYQLEGTNLLRVEKSDAITVAARPVARHIASYSDAVFYWDSVGRVVSTTITATVDTGVLTTTLSTTVRASLRPRSQVAAPTPGVIPTPTPVPGQVTYYCGADPTILQGTYVSGGCDPAMLADDTSYYVVNSTTGANKQVEWEVYSQVITHTTVSAVSVRFVGRVDKSGVAQSFFVYGASGYPAVPDQASTYADANTDKTVSFDFTQEEIDYLNTLTGTNKRIRLKMSAQASANFSHASDQLLFFVN